MTIEYWTTADALNGLCEMEEVGDIRETARVEPPTPALDQEPPMSDDVFEIEYAAYRRDPDRYRSSSPSNLNKLMDVMARRQEKKQEEKPTYMADRISASQLAQMSLPDLKRLFITRMLHFVPEDRQAEALEAFKLG